jgi:hypothetical protein
VAITARQLAGAHDDRTLLGDGHRLSSSTPSELELNMGNRRLLPDLIGARRCVYVNPGTV